MLAWSEHIPTSRYVLSAHTKHKIDRWKDGTSPSSLHCHYGESTSVHELTKIFEQEVESPDLMLKSDASTCRNFLELRYRDVSHHKKNFKRFYSFGLQGRRSSIWGMCIPGTRKRKQPARWEALGTMKEGSWMSGSVGPIENQQSSRQQVLQTWKDKEWVNMEMLMTSQGILMEETFTTRWLRPWGGSSSCRWGSICMRRVILQAAHENHSPVQWSSRWEVFQIYLSRISQVMYFHSILDGWCQRFLEESFTKWML